MFAGDKPNEKLHEKPADKAPLEFYTNIFMENSTGSDHRLAALHGSETGEAKFWAYQLALQDKQIALLKTRNAIARQRNAIAIRSNSIAKQQLKATRQLNKTLARLCLTQWQATGAAPASASTATAAAPAHKPKKDDNKKAGK